MIKLDPHNRCRHCGEYPYQEREVGYFELEYAYTCQPCNYEWRVLGKDYSLTKEIYKGSNVSSGNMCKVLLDYQKNTTEIYGLVKREDKMGLAYKKISSMSRIKEFKSYKDAKHFLSRYRLLE